MSKRDLVVLLADLDAENAIKTLISARCESLRIRSMTFDTYRHQMRDSGCCGGSGAFLRSFSHSHAHAMVVFDKHGSGKDQLSAEEIEKAVEHDLTRNGWAQEHVACVVFEPELESWVWADSNHVADALGFGPNPTDLRKYLLKEGMITKKETKPLDPKAAVESCRQHARIRRSARFFSKLAERVSLSSCVDPAFEKFKSTLQRWFPSR